MMVNFHLIDMQHLLVTLQYKCSSSTVSTRGLEFIKMFGDKAVEFDIPVATLLLSKI